MAKEEKRKKSKRFKIIAFVVIPIVVAVISILPAVLSNNYEEKSNTNINITNIDNSNTNNITNNINSYNEQNNNEIVSGDSNEELIEEGISDHNDIIEIDDIVMSESGYTEYLEQFIEQDIIFKYYNDYDGDGDCELFAVVGEVVEKPEILWTTLTGEIWFVDDMGACMVEKTDKSYFTEPFIFLCDSNCFIAFEEAYVTGTLTYIWGVRDGKPYQPNISGKGNGLSINSYNEIELCDSDYDAGLSDGLMSGHTWKNYYLYYDGDTFREYGGLKISTDELKKIDGTEKIINDIIIEGYEIDSIYYRENGIININFSLADNDSIRYKNITLRCKQAGFEVVPSMYGKYNEGIYQSAMIPAIATYPSSYPY